MVCALYSYFLFFFPGQSEQARHVLQDDGAFLTTLEAAAWKPSTELLESVSMSDIPAAERMCPICYDKYGVEGPDGISEKPLRISRCKHVFGDRCVRKWLCQKYSCPYCRTSVSRMGDSKYERRPSDCVQVEKAAG